MKGYGVPPECQGQTQEVAYMCAGSRMLRRTHDRSDNEISYAVAEIRQRDWGWYETYQQCNGAPPIPDRRWKFITEACALRIAAEWL